MRMLVRRARSGELAAVGALTADAYAVDGFVTDADEYAAQLRDAASRAAQAEVYVATDPQEQLLGTVTFCPRGSAYREVADDGEGEFRMLAVTAAARGRGVAEALVRRCLERSEELGYHAVVLCSMEQQAPAHRLYERLGFRRTPERDWRPIPSVHLLAFRRDLTPPG